MKAEHELWAIALWVEKTHGSGGPDHIAEQVSRLATQGDKAGVARWQQIAERYDALVVRAGLPS
jgi:hypothetical protein